MITRVPLCEKCAEKFSIIPDYAGTFGSCSLCYETTRTSTTAGILGKRCAEDFAKFAEENNDYQNQEWEIWEGEDMQVVADFSKSTIFVDHGLDEHLEIAINDDGEISFWHPGHLGPTTPITLTFTRKQLNWLYSKASLFSMRRYTYLQKQKEGK